MHVRYKDVVLERQKVGESKPAKAHRQRDARAGDGTAGRVCKTPEEPGLARGTRVKPSAMRRHCERGTVASFSKMVLAEEKV